MFQTYYSFLQTVGVNWKFLIENKINYRTLINLRKERKAAKLCEINALIHKY